jgi:hypothetical protein
MKRIPAVALLILTLALLLLSFSSAALADGSDPIPPFKKKSEATAFQSTATLRGWPATPSGIGA